MTHKMNYVITNCEQILADNRSTHIANLEKFREVGVGLKVLNDKVDTVQKTKVEFIKENNFQPNGRLNSNAFSPRVPIPTKRMENILVVGTSLTNKLNKQVIQNVTENKVTMAKAFTIDEKDGAVRPELNHKRVVPSELAKNRYDTLVLEGGVNEISNMNVDQDFIANIDILKKKVAQDSINMYNLAEESLAKHPGLKKVIILKRIFRCDNTAKESLSQYANLVYDDIWNKKGRPSNIFIADQKLQCEGNLRSVRYGNQHYESYDGVHMRGKLSAQHYTRSIIDVFTAVWPELLTAHRHRATITKHTLSRETAKYVYQ